MGAKQEQVVQEMLAAWGGGKVPADAEKIASYFAKDGYWRLYEPAGPTIQGRDAILAEIKRQMGYVDLPECNTKLMVSSDKVVMTEREDYFTKNGRRARHSLTAVFELNDQNEITAWREYFDLNDLAKETAADPNKLSGLE